MFNVGLRMGGKRVQGLLGIGVQPGDDQDARFSVFWGLGLHTPLPGPLWITFWRHRTADDLDLQLGLGFVAGVSISPRWGRLNGAR